MGGWFKEIKTVADLKGLKMRIPGIGGEVMGRLGAAPQALPGGEIYAALERGVIDAAEWIGPYDDEKLGLYKIAKHYYYPAFWEGGTEICIMINAAAWDKLPKPYQEAVESAAAEAHVKMQAQYDAKNPIALKSLLGNGVKLHPFPRDVLRAANKAAFELYEAEAAKNPAFKKIYEPWKKFRDQQYEWFSLAELSFSSLAVPGKSRGTPVNAAGPWLPRALVRGAAVLVAVAALALAPVPAQAEAARPYRIGVLNEAWAPNHPTVEGLKAGLRARGLAEGRDVVFEVHFTEGKSEELPAEARALIKAKVDLIFTNNEAAALAAKDRRPGYPGRLHARRQSGRLRRRHRPGEAGGTTAVT